MKGTYYCTDCDETYKMNIGEKCHICGGDISAGSCRVHGNHGYCVQLASNPAVINGGRWAKMMQPRCTSCGSEFVQNSLGCCGYCGTPEDGSLKKPSVNKLDEVYPFTVLSTYSVMHPCCEAPFWDFRIETGKRGNRAQ